MKRTKLCIKRIIFGCGGCRHFHIDDKFVPRCNRFHEIVEDPKLKYTCLTIGIKIGIIEHRLEKLKKKFEKIYVSLGDDDRW